MEESLTEFGHPWQLNPGDGAFYGPKVSQSPAEEGGVIVFFIVNNFVDDKFSILESGGGMMISKVLYSVFFETFFLIFLIECQKIWDGLCVV